jgi:uncharacterized Zn-binding protein involved in type VI secretion
MGAPAARLTDEVKGLDTHIVNVPSPGGPVPTPVALVFSGSLTSDGVTDVIVDGLPAAAVGTVATNLPQHVPPPGTSFVTTPSDSGTVSQGSASVSIGGRPAARLGDAVRTCNDPVDADTSAITSGSGTVTIG